MSADARTLARRPTARQLDRRRWGRFPPAVVIIVLCVIVAISIYLFMTLGARGSWSFIIPFRGRKVLGMLLVGTAISVSTVLFQTVTTNRILTPSIMGFDALYMLLQTCLAFFLGATGLTQLDGRMMFAIETLGLMFFAGALYYWLFVVGHRSLHLLVLAGIVLGVMLRSVTNLLQRVMDPLTFAVLQDTFFASFNTFDATLLLPAGIVVGAALYGAWRMRHTLDILALGREMALGLGVDYRRTVTRALAIITALVSVSTALVGPVTFFGLIVANLAYALLRSYRHRVIMPAAALLAAVVLILGQTVLERVLGLGTSLSVIVEFAGGLLFIYLVLRGVVR